MIDRPFYWVEYDKEYSSVLVIKGHKKEVGVGLYSDHDKMEDKLECFEAIAKELNDLHYENIKLKKQISKYREREKDGGLLL